MMLPKISRRRAIAAASYAAVRPLIEQLEDRTLLASIASISPPNLGIGVAPDAHLSVTFGSAMNASTITSSTYELLNSNSQVVSTRLSYNANNLTATLDALSPLAYHSTYTLKVIGGSSGVKDSGGGTLASTFTSTFTTAAVPTSGPGGPILVLTNSTDLFSAYYPEILKAEGLNEFATADISTLSSSLLGSYQLVVLGEVPLAASQVTTLSNWVTGGGDLIAMRPDTQLDPLLGITATGQSLSEGYLLINNSTPIGAGLVNTTIQYHGTADLYTLSGATALAGLYSDATTATSRPAVTLRSVGSGQAGAFMFDLAQSVVETRQGNPAWAGQSRDGQTVTRADDQFLGASPTDTETDWVNLNKVNIPQADEQQRLFANMIEQMQLASSPLPRFWYFPNGAKAVIDMTGDDHNSGGTATRWSGYIADGTSGGMPITGTSYLFPGSANSNATMAQYEAEGFDPALHIDIDPGLTFGTSSDAPINWTSESELMSIYQQQLATFDSTYPSLPSPTTVRTHGVVWSDYATQPIVEFANGIRMDTNYYYWPATWINDHPGMFTGSGLPMLFATASGQTIDVFQESTVMTDESGQTSDYNINALLAGATGPQGFYGAWAIQAHTDSFDTAGQAESAAVIAAAQAYNVPVISTQDLLNFEDGRDGSSFSGTTWNASTGTLSFNISTAVGSSGLTTMVPLVAANGANVSGITINGSAVSFTRQLIAGIYYAFFNAASGAVSVKYTANSTPLSIAATTPAAGAANVANNSTVTAKFNEAIDAATLAFNLMDSSGNVVPATVSYNASTLTATLAPTNVLRSGFTYTATISALDSSDHATAPVTWSFTTAAPVVSAGTTYSLWNASVTPSIASDPTAVEVGIQFTSDVNGYVTGVSFYKGSQNTGTHIGNLWTSGGTLLATATFSNETASGWQTVTFSKPVPILAGQTYVASYHTNSGYYAYSSGYFNSSGTDSGPLHALANSMVLGGTGVFTISTTSTFPNATYDGSNYWVDVQFKSGTVTIPTVTARTPTVGSTNVAANTTVSATFSEAIQLSTLSFVLKDSNGNSVAATVAYNSATNTATLTPNASLNPFTTYVATVSGAQDALGNAMIAPVNWNFTTAPAVAGTVTIWGTAIPGNNGEQDPTAVEVGVKFESTVAGQITGVRFYKAAQNTGVHTGSLWSASGQLLDTGTFSNESASGWQTLTFASPVQIQANTVYVASYHTNTGYYADDYYYFSDGGASNNPLIALQSGVSGGNGVYAVGSGGVFPSQSYEDSNYWVDVTFVPGAVTAPAVTAVSPINGATGISTSPTITLSFNEALNPSTVNSSTIQLLDSSNNVVAATVSYTAGSTSVTLTPNSPLANSATYTVKATSGVQDNNGNSLTPFSSTFTTAVPASQALSLWSSGTVPGTVTVNDPNAVEVGVKFESSVAGTITGIRFYKGPQNTGTHIGNLWDASGDLLATATFTNESETGWQQVSFAKPVQIQPNTEYIASYYTSVGYYSADNNYFTTAYSNGPLTALADGTSGGNGVYMRGSSSSFPSNSWEASNYWVDVVFNPSTSVVPTVVSQTPAPGATSVSTGTTITATFNEAVTAGSIVFSLKDSNNNVVATTLSYNSSTNTATWTPTAALANNKTYTATISAATDANNNSLAAPVSWSFTTAAAVVPTVVSQTPTSGATNVATNTTVTATFNEAVTPSSIVFTLKDSSNNVIATTFSYNSTTNTATWTPTAALANSKTYTATISAATDANNNSLASPVSWSFTTAAATGQSVNLFGNATPGTVNEQDPNAVEVGVKFQANVAGTISGIRFYKGSQNTGTHIGNLWSSTGTLLAKATFTNETASGWQTVTFSTPVQIQANTTYIASYYAPVGYYSADNNYFTSAFTNGTLTALASGTSGGNGVYTRGPSSSFPTSTWEASNYWVDVVFNPNATVVPTVVSQTPISGATNVATNTTVTATFNEAVTPGSIVFTLKDSNNNVIATTLSYNSSTNTATWTPTTALTNNLTYTATISAATDANNNSLAAPVSWSFTTVPASNSWTQTPTSGFSARTNSGTTVTSGGVQMANELFDHFTGSALSSNWTTQSWSGHGGGPLSDTVASSILSIKGGLAMSTPTVGLAPFTAVATFGASSGQAIGLTTASLINSGITAALIRTTSSTALQAIVYINGATTTASLGTIPSGSHTYSINPTSTSVQFLIDGVVKATIKKVLPTSSQYSAVVSATAGGSAAPFLQVNSVTIGFPTTATFTSSVFDSGKTSTWLTATWDATLPTGAGIVIETRSGNTPTPDASWSAWQSVSNGSAVASPAGRYLQYEVIFTTSNQNVTATLQDITFQWF